MERRCATHPQVALLLATLTLSSPCVIEAQGTRDDYARAERFLTPRVDSLVLNERVVPNWIRESDRFWYRRDLTEGKEFMVVDPAGPSRRPAFDHAALAAALTRATGDTVTPHALPFGRFSFSDGDTAIELEVRRTRWRCALVEPRCERAAADTEPNGASPDGRWIAFTRDHDLYVRSSETGREIRLTHDGEPDRRYGTALPSPTLMVRQRTTTPATTLQAFWSPDSRRLATYRVDARGAGTLSMVQHAPPDRVRPRHYTYFYPLPEDSVLPTADLFVFEVGAWAPVRAAIEPIPMQYYGAPGRPRWSDDGARLSIVITNRGYTRRHVADIDAASGVARVTVDERGEPYVDLYAGTMVHPLPNDEWLWGSERDGWMHLYVFDGGTGAVKRRLTRGAWVVEDLTRVDPAGRAAYFIAGGREPGRDPYLRHLYRVGLDGGPVRLLTPEDADHAVTFSPTGAFFVDTYSRPHVEPVSVLRRAADGSVVLELERADISRLVAAGWRRPEPFTTTARDDTTTVYGLVWWPSTYDATKRYPVIEQIYTGPHNFFVPKSFSAYRSTAQSIAELGFVVVQVDGLGTSGRGRAFHLHSYKNLGDGGIPDHIAALRQLASRHPSLDLSRVGIFGHSAGGYDAAHAMLTHPEFYRVAVSSAGNHDHRMDKAVWNTQWMGWPVGEHYHAQSNVTLAPRLQGKLLLVHGDTDENVPVSATLQLVNALIDANKDFDLLIMPNQPHGLGRHPYFVRKRWDFFVKHLLGVDPPEGYRVPATSDN